MHSNHEFAVCWVPSHVDKLKFTGGKHRTLPKGLAMQRNDRVDKACTKSINEQIEKPDEEWLQFIHRSVVVACLIQNMYHKWRHLMLKRSYCGNGLMFPKAEFDRVPHSYKKSPILGTHGKCNRDYARLTQVLTNHLLCEAFCERFNKEGP